MGISVQPTQVHPQVIQQQDNSGALFLQALLGGANMAQNYQQMQLQKEQAERAERERELERANATAEGEALRQIIMGFGQQELNRADQTVRDAVSMAGVTRGMPGGSPPLPQQAMAGAGPSGQLASAVQGAPAQAVKGIAATSLPLMQIAEKKRGEADRIANIERAIASVAPDKQKGARAVLTFAEMGANLPSAMHQQLWPELFPAEGGVDSQALNAATSLFKSGVFTWGQARRQAGVPQMSGVPDDVKYTPPALKYERRPTEQQNKASAQLTVMQSAAPILDAYSAKQAPGLIASVLKSAKGGSLAEIVANPLLSDDDRNFLQAGRQFVDGWVRAVSGAQTNEQEFSRILRATIETFGDSGETREQKRNMRQQMMLAVQDIASGTMTRDQVLGRMLQMDWSPDQKKLLLDYQAKAKQFEASLKTGRAPMEMQGPVQGGDDMADRMARIEAALMQAMAGREP